MVRGGSNGRPIHYCFPIWSKPRSTTLSISSDTAAVRPDADAGQQSGQLDGDLFGDFRLQLPVGHRSVDRPQRSTTTTWTNSGSAPNCAYGGNANAPSWNEAASGPFIYSSNGVDTGPPGFGGSSISTSPGSLTARASTAAFSERASRQSATISPRNFLLRFDVPSSRRRHFRYRRLCQTRSREHAAGLLPDLQRHATRSSQRKPRRRKLCG